MPWPCDWKNFMSKNGVSFKVLNGTKQPNGITGKQQSHNFVTKGFNLFASQEAWLGHF